jgi:hypothetical protein
MSLSSPGDHPGAPFSKAISKRGLKPPLRPDYAQGCLTQKKTPGPTKGNYGNKWNCGRDCGANSPVLFINQYFMPSVH